MSGHRGVVIISGGDTDHDGHPDYAVLTFPPADPVIGLRTQVGADGLPYADSSPDAVPSPLGLFYDATTGDPYLDSASSDPAAALFVDGDGTPYLTTGA